MNTPNMRKTETTVADCPRSTPWGHADNVRQIAPGIWSVSTPGHGGIYLAPWRRAGLPDYITDGTGYSSDGWFEEDCDCMLACAAFPVEFGPGWCKSTLEWMESPQDYLRERRAKFLASPMVAVLRAEAAKFTEGESSSMSATARAFSIYMGHS